MSLCPCNSEKDFNECCAAILEGKQEARSAEELMRSRYCAFTTADVDYIISTHNPETREGLKASEIKDWAMNSTWLGLEILATKDGIEGDSEGVVEFIASYNMDGTIHRHHEVSTFDFIDGKWYFTDGKQKPIKSEKVGRNDPCPCNSGKKFKKCCAR